MEFFWRNAKKLKWVCDEHNKFWARVDFVRAIYRMEVGTRARASERASEEWMRAGASCLSS